MPFESAIEAIEREQEESAAREERAAEKRRKEKQRQCGDWTVRALGTFVACQALGITPEKFPLGYTGFVFTNLSGDVDGMAKACEKFVNDMQGPLGEAYEKQQQAREA